jgi:hypothetical protein
MHMMIRQTANKAYCWLNAVPHKVSRMTTIEAYQLKVTRLHDLLNWKQEKQEEIASVI